MKKTLYSLMLSEDVVREVDALAHRRGLTRSGLVNQILAEYTGYITPERRINDIFAAIESIMAPSRDLIPFFEPNAMTMSLKSSLEYKYRPTVRYEVELNKNAGDSLGILSVVFRTQSTALLEAMSEFFRLWKSIEDRRLPVYAGIQAEHALYDGRFVRTIALPRARDYGNADIAEALSAYIRLFDNCMKGYLAGRYTGAEIEGKYMAWLSSGNILI